MSDKPCVDLLAQRPVFIDVTVALSPPKQQLELVPLRR
jgi:hypothetical protein